MAGSIFLIKCTKEAEKLTGLKNIKYKSSDFWIFKKNIKILRINDCIFGFLWNLIINQKNRK